MFVGVKEMETADVCIVAFLVAVMNDTLLRVHVHSCWSGLHRMGKPLQCRRSQTGSICLHSLQKIISQDLPSFFLMTRLEYDQFGPFGNSKEEEGCQYCNLDS